MGRTFKNILGDLRGLLEHLVGDAAHAAETALADLEGEAVKVRTTVAELAAQAKADIEAAVEQADPEIKAEVSQVVAKLEADLEAALAQLAIHAL